MSENTSFVIAFQKEPAADPGTGFGSGGDGGGNIDLEQEEELVGESPCLASSGPGGTDFVVGIRAFVAPADLNYKMTITRGVLSAGVLTEEESAESIDFNLALSATTRNNYTDPTYSWEGDCIDENGQVVPGPSVSFDGTNVFTVSDLIIGTLRVSGTIAYVRYEATIPKRGASEPSDTNDQGDQYAAKVVALWDSSVAQLKIEAPENGECYEKTDIGDPDDEKCYKKTRYLDPCTGLQTREDEITEIACPEGSEGGSGPDE